MVTGEEYVFENIYDAKDYILAAEADALSKDEHRKSAPIVFRPPLFNVPFEEYLKTAHISTNSLDYPLSAYYKSQGTRWTRAVSSPSSLLSRTGTFRT
mgnify:CR=1 FL=1